MIEHKDKHGNENMIEGRNAVLEAFRSGKPVDKLFVLDGCQDGPVRTIVREAKKHDTLVQFVDKERLTQLSQTGRHQGVIAYTAAYEYAQVEDMLALAKERGEDPFLILLDDIEDPHNLGAIIRTANLAGAHGVIIPKRRAVGLTATVAKTSAGAINYTPVAKVTNLTKTMKELKEKGLWFVCADMGGESMYKLNLTGPIGLAPEFFRKVYPLLPFVHSMNAMRECIAGFYGMNYWIELGKLALFLIPALLLGLILRKPVIKLNDAFTEKLENTHLI